MVYLNNAATSYPKPQRVLDAHAATLKNPPSGQFRSSGFFQKSDPVMSCKRALSELLGIPDADRIFFSSGATDSSNKVIYGLNLSQMQILTTVTEHNSILRPLYNHQGIKPDQIHLIGCNPLGRINLVELESMAKKSNAGIVIVNHCSNVTGMVQDLEQIGILCRQNHLLFMVDASQSAGCIPIDVEKLGIDILILTGHKSLFGIQGTGAHYVKKDLFFRPLLFGGTGKDSSKLHYEKDEYEYEVGTQNIPGIVALQEGILTIQELGLNHIVEKERALMKQLYEGLMEFEEIRLFGQYEENRGPLLSFQMRGLSPSDVAYILETGDQILVRTGLHCAPLMHDGIGSGKEGTVRVSISVFTKEIEIDLFLQAIKSIVLSLRG